MDRSKTRKVVLPALTWFDPAGFFNFFIGPQKRRDPEKEYAVMNGKVSWQEQREMNPRVKSPVSTSISPLHAFM